MSPTSENATGADVPAAASEPNVIKCPECSQQILADGLEPLTTVGCPACPADVFVPHRLQGYYLYDTLAVGGMGTVYRAFHPDHPEHRYAVKLLPKGDYDPILLDNMTAEIAAIEALGEHACLVRYIESGWIGKEPYLITELVDGDSMHTRIERAGKLPELETLLIGLRVISAEAHMYDRGYLFRDIKPENIIIHDERGAHLCDFGICMTLDEALNDSGDMVQGSPLYFPPERLLGEGEQASSEIYSIGLVLYYALTGHPYYNATEIEAVAHLHVWSGDDDKDLERKMMKIKPDLAEVIKRMINRDASARYQSFLEVERDLFQILCNRLYTRGF